MVLLRECAALGRTMRMEDSLAELGENTVAKLKEAIALGDKELALALSDYFLLEGKALHDLYTDWTYADLDYVARQFGEEEVPKILRHVREALSRTVYTKTGQLTMLETIQMYAEFMRAHRSGPREVGELRIWEEADRYVMEFDPCGSGGRMMRGPLDGSGSRLLPPHNMGKTTKPYPWTWGKVGVPYYCAHCCVWNEIMPLEARGYPNRVTEYPADDPGRPCYLYYYKHPSLIPEAYFERVGFKKDPTKLK